MPDYGVENGRISQAGVDSEDQTELTETVGAEVYPTVYDAPQLVAMDNVSAVGNDHVTTSSSNDIEDSAKDTTATSATSSNYKPLTTPGKFVLRSYKRADPFHVLQSLMSPDKTSSGAASNPELDDLVTYIRQHGGRGQGRQDGAYATNQRNSSTDTSQTEANRASMTSTLVDQFNREAQSEVGQQYAQNNSLAAQTTTAQRNESTSQAVAKQRVDVTASQSSSGSLNAAAQSTERSKTVTVTPSSATANGNVLSSATSSGVTSSNDVKSLTAVTSSNRALTSQSVTNSKPTNAGTVAVEAGGVASTVTPAWKAEIERRKQTKDYVVCQKPKQPITLYETPAWKKELVEKNKSRKSSSGDGAEPTSAELRAAMDSEWKAEIRQALKQKSVSEEQEIPEWQRLADKK